MWTLFIWIWWVARFIIPGLAHWAKQWPTYHVDSASSHHKTLNKSSNLEKFHSVWCEMTYPWWCRTVVAVGLFHSDPKGSSCLMAPWIPAFHATCHCTKGFLYPGLIRVVHVIWAEKEWFSDCSIPLKTANWVHNLYYSPDIIRMIHSKMRCACSTNGDEEERI
jgi:hypothetical protein